MSMSLKEFYAYDGNKPTTKKEIIYDFLKKKQRAYTTNEIMKELKINRSTVTRSLHCLRKERKITVKDVKGVNYHAIKQK